MGKAHERLERTLRDWDRVAADYTPASAEFAQADARSLRVLRRMQALSEAERRLLIIYMEVRSLREVARWAGCSATAVKKNLTN